MFAFHHVTLNVRNLDAAEGFYKGLGFEPDYRWQDEQGELQICHLRLGQARLELYCFRPVEEPELVALPPWAQGHRLGLRHFALQVEDLDDALSSLHGAGLLADKPTPVPGQICARYVFIMDPDGNSVELLETPLVQIQRPE
ncbi:VOC family protein [Oceanimonas baumannii]|uniref:Glyoxalase n=1 Tax=Oceanimonas baumannii TaxID=129578 RepID=A0A235CBD1_9GAMM|nr:VOC family protein [Oceanimonas baumannii]OYD21297.1 glyoxalase [Oceanimonas baumannii]TDW55353.1 glyoxylase I family protein [Oceanimonas baumannii]